jgi:outer membrane lipoprotein-sorting protein
MLMWRLALQHGSFELLPAESNTEILLLSAATPSFLKAAAHRADFFQPHQLRIQLHAPTRAPMSIEILSADGSVTWKNTYSLWRAVPAESSDFTYVPPQGAKVLSK